MRAVVIARGHPNITARHKTTLEITKDENLTIEGDCIIGVGANRSISELPQEVKTSLIEGRMAKITLYLPAYGLKEEVEGYGSHHLTFRHPTDIVIRKSNYVCDRTLIVRANKAASDVDREMISLLKDPSTELHFIIEV